MEWKIEVEATCSALGTYDGTKYYKDDDCLECIKDLIRFLRRDDDNHTLRRSLGQIGVVRTDLIPILRDYHEEAELFDMCLRLMVNLTSPEILLFREEMPEDKTMRNYYLQLQSHRQMYKRSFIDEKLWAVLTENLGKLLRKEFDERSEDDRMIIERILILVRNILQVPRDANNEKRTDGDVSIHDQVLWVLHKSGMEDLLLFIASSDDETQYCLHVLEIISLMFREQDPKNLATANFQRSKEEKVEDEMALLKIRNQEMEKKKQKFHQFSTSRHSRFGGTFTVQNVKSISERDLIYHKPLSAVNQIDFDQKKRPIKISRNRVTPGDVDVKRRSTLSIRLFLKEFCIEFLHGAYNKLMFVVKDFLNRKKAQQNDETYHLWAMKFFMEFNRIHKFRVDLVTETLSKGTFHYVHQQIEAYKDNYEHEKKNRPMCLMWARRMHLAVRAYQELLLNLVAMSKSEDVKVRESAVILRADVFYEPEYRELCLQQLSLYQPEKMSLGYLRDLVETTHVFLKIMENMAKSKHIMVSKKTKRKKKVGGKSSTKGGSAVPVGTIFLGGSREANEAKWDEISSTLSRILQGEGDDLPTGVTPFDAASDVPIDEQKSAAMYRIQDHLKKVRPAEAIALLRASREVWPENDAFGAADADAEDEFMALREILFADIPKPSHLGDVEEGNLIEETAEIGEEAENDQEFEEEEEEGEEEYVTYSTEQEFDFRQFVMKFASKSICTAFGILFSNYEHNTEYTNLCIIKMFHRIAFDCSLPALLFHVSIFRTFQRIYKDFCLTPTNPSLRELCKFAKFLLRKFFEICPKNPHIFMELCFWKNAREATEIIEGYGTQSATSKQKASYWCEEDEEKLSRVFRQLKEMEQNGQGSGESGDLLDNISAFFIDSGKSRRQVAKKLKDLALIADIKEVTKKPLKLRASREWSEDEVNQLKALYKEFKDAVDPVNRIIERMEVKRQKKRIVEKIMELGLCDDMKKLMRKKVRRGLKEGDPGYLERASDTDSALEDSSEGSDSSDQDGSANSSDSEADDRSNDNDGGELELVKTLKALLVDEGFKSPLEWLKNSLSDEAEDRETEDCDDNEGVPVLPLAEDCIMAMEKEPFLNVMRMLEIAPPGSEQEQYWRIPAQLSAASLKTKAAFLEKALEGNFEVGDLNVNYLGGRPTLASKSASKKSKKKKEKRGPNKWMPMKRAVDEEALARIEAMFPSRPKPVSTKKSSAEKPKKSGRGKKSEEKKSGAKEKKPKARRKLKTVESDLSGNEDDDEEKENREDSDKESSDNESDESEEKSVVQKKKTSPKKKKVKSSFLESSDDDDGDKLVIDNDSEKENSAVDSDATIKNSVEKSKKNKLVDSSDDESEKVVDTTSSSSKPSRNKGRLMLSSDSEAEPEVSKPEVDKTSSPIKAQSSSPAKSRSRSSSLSSGSSSRSASPNSVLDSSRISRPSSRVSRSSRLSSSRSSSSSISSRSSSPRSVFATPSSRTSLLTTASQKVGGSSVRSTPKRVRGGSGSSSGQSDSNDDVITKSRKKSTKKPKLDEKTPVKKGVAGSQKKTKKKPKLNSSDEDETPVKASGSKVKKATKLMDVSDGEEKNDSDSEKDKSPVKTKSKVKRRTLSSDSE